MYVPESQEVRDERHLREIKRELHNRENRLRRALRSLGLRLRKSRSKKDQWLLGEYYVTDAAAIMPILRNVDLDHLTRQLHRRNIWVS